MVVRDSKLNNNSLESAQGTMRKLFIPVGDAGVLTRRPKSIHHTPLKTRKIEDELTDQDVTIILSLQHACYGYVFPQIRMISINWGKKFIEAYFYVDGDLSTDDCESLNLIDTYFCANFGGRIVYESTIVRSDYPQPITNYLGECL